MTFTLLPHAFAVLRERKVPLMVLEMVLREPQQIIPERQGRVAYQSIVEIADRKTALLRAIVEEGEPLIVVTVYYTTKLEKYWRSE